MQHYKHILSLALLYSALPLSLLYAHPTVNNTATTIQPRITAEGLTGDHTVGLVDTLLPMPINQQLNNNELLFLDGRGRITSDDSEEMNWGVGYRRILGEQSYILGAYAFYDGMESAHNHYFQAITAGVERLGHGWDGRANYYQPVGKKKFAISHTYSNPTIAGHFITVDDEEKFEESVPGYDLELGGVLTGHLHHDLKGFVSYYHFGWHDDAKIDGERIRFEQALTPGTKLVAWVQCDNQKHWQSYFGIRLSLGGIKSTTGTTSPLDRPINERLTDFVIRDLNVLTANTRRAGRYQAPDRLLLVDNTVSTSGDGTFETPFASLDDALAVANSTDLIFMKTGTGTYDVGEVSLHPNQRISSGLYAIKLPNREETLPFFNEERPIITGRINLAHGNQLNNLIIDANNEQHYGIYGNNTDWVNLTHIDVMNSKKMGIRIDNSNNVNIANAHIHHNKKQGLYLSNDSNVHLQSVQVNNNLKEGIYIKNTTHTTITGTQSTDNDRRGIYTYLSSGTSTGSQWINNTREGWVSKDSTFTITNDTLRNNSVGSTRYPEAYSYNDSLLKFYGLKQLDGKFKAARGGTLVMHTGEDIISIINGTTTLGVH